MANLFSSSIGRKLLMSITGLFLIVFLLVHLTLNSFLLLDGVLGFEEGQMFNAGAHFMATNPFIKIMEPMLAIGFLVHIMYSIGLTIQNIKARGAARYASGSKTDDVEWSSKNMFVLGIFVVSFLVVHLANFWVKMKITGDPLLHQEASFPFMGAEAHGENAYALVNTAFQNIAIVIIYVIGCIALSFHLSHGFWSAFQTIGWNNTVWLNRLQTISKVVAWFIGLGFCVIAIAQYLFF
ncbi:MAG: succinate dehydrogenase cytochrome b subunit [Bacteroidales bacterium]|nr:succinate dehydrogenase cytochrome b subunit [Bacteroidales bacterium]